MYVRNKQTNKQEISNEMQIISYGSAITLRDLPKGLHANNRRHIASMFIAAAFTIDIGPIYLSKDKWM